jgi:primosomal protein N' (replication factor Y)
MNPAVLRVALDTPLRRLFDYLPPAAPVAVGQRVRVPFGRQRLVGLVMEEAAASDLPMDRLKPVLEVLDSEPVLDRSAIELLKWAADYYHHPIGEVIATAMPKALREGAATVAVEQVWSLTPAGSEALATGEPRRAPKQRQVLELLARQEETSAAALGALMEGWADGARALAKRGWAVSRERAVVPGEASVTTREGVTAKAPPDLAPEQHEAVERISESLGKFGAFVLHGITGSGKTEVYLRVVQRALARGQRALVLVPEIGLTPQLVERFTERFDVPLSVLHSALTDSERLEAWRAAFSGHSRIVLGTRSAVFAPVRDLGIIVVDEEHDASYKQHEGGFRYSARDLAVVRAQQAGVPIVLGSATPALESLHNVSNGRYV